MKEFLFQFFAFYMGFSIGEYIILKYKLNWLQGQVVGILSLVLTFGIFGMHYRIDTLEFWGCLILASIMSHITIDNVAEKEGLRK